MNVAALSHGPAEPGAAPNLEHLWNLTDCLCRLRCWYDEDRNLLALAHLNQWTEARPEVAAFWYYRAAFCSRLGLRLEEVKSWRGLLQLNPANRLLVRMLHDRLAAEDSNR